MGVSVYWLLSLLFIFVHGYVCVSVISSQNTSKNPHVFGKNLKKGFRQYIGRGLRPLCQLSNKMNGA